MLCKNKLINKSTILCNIHGSHFFKLTNLPDFSSIFCRFPVLFKVHFLFKVWYHICRVFTITGWQFSLAIPVFFSIFQYNFSQIFQYIEYNSLTFPWLENAFPFFQVFLDFQSRWEPWTFDYRMVHILKGIKAGVRVQILKNFTILKPNYTRSFSN